MNLLDKCILNQIILKAESGALGAPGGLGLWYSLVHCLGFLKTEHFNSKRSIKSISHSEITTAEGVRISTNIKSLCVCVPARFPRSDWYLVCRLQTIFKVTQWPSFFRLAFSHPCLCLLKLCLSGFYILTSLLCSPVLVISLCILSVTLPIILSLTLFISTAFHHPFPPIFLHPLVSPSVLNLCLSVMLSPYFSLLLPHFLLLFFLFFFIMPSLFFPFPPFFFFLPHCSTFS